MGRVLARRLYPYSYAPEGEGEVGYRWAGR
eukprot:COSAG02_NODE_42444_length_384_cov_1.101754_1_plen_29_part_10